MEHVDVLIVGAGLSGIGAARTIQAECPWATFAVLEARDAIGGTWDLFRYPGIRSDSDMYTLGYSFRPWDGEQSIADGASILRYIRDTASETGIDRAVRFNHRIVAADWSSAEGRWHVTAERSDTGDTVELTCGFLFSCAGYYRYDHGYLPDFAGMDRFAGLIVHPQAWPDDLEVEGKRIVVIGSGATAMTLVPALAQSAAHVTMLQRSPTYVLSLPAKDPMVGLLRKVLPTSVAAPVVRWMKALTTQASFQASRRWPGPARRLLRKQVARQLPDGYDIDTHFTPRYDPWDQRLCVVPEGDLFKAIGSGAASVVTDQVETFTEDGLRLASGDALVADIIVTATGLELLFVGGIALAVDGRPVDIGNTLTYQGMMLEGVPNLALAIGYTNASWTLKCDLICTTVTRLLQHMRAVGSPSCTPVNLDAAGAEPEPLLGLTSGYVQRSADLFPKQGAAFPWRVHQSYLRDYRAMKMHGIDHRSLVFAPPLAAGGPGGGNGRTAGTPTGAVGTPGRDGRAAAAVPVAANRA